MVDQSLLDDLRLAHVMADNADSISMARFRSLDLDVSTYLVQNIKRAEVHAIGSNDRVRMPRQPLSGERRSAVDRIVLDAIATRPPVPILSLAKAA